MANREANTSVFRSVDWFTIVLYLIMVVAGAVSIYAASYDFDGASLFDPAEFSGKQFMWIGLALVLGFAMMLLDYRLYETYAYPVYGLILLLLVVTIFVAPNINGSRSWIVLGPVSLQPAEFGKFATALALAKLFSSYGFSLKRDPMNAYMRALTIILLPVVLILMQRETGSALVYFSLVFVLYREGMSGLVLLAAVAAITWFVVAVKFTSPLFLGLQAGEFSVLLMIMLLMLTMLAGYCKDRLALRTAAIIYGVCGVVMGVLALCGVDAGGFACMLTAIILSALTTAFFGLRHHIQRYLVTIVMALGGVALLLSTGYVFNNVLEPHQQMRIKVALGIEDDPRGAGYNVNQSKIAIGSGGLTGKGFLNGTQTKLRYVPEQHTDFIYCTIGEEEGFVGSTAVLVAFAILLLRLIHIAERQHTVFGRVYGYCVVSYMTFHLCINVGMVIGLCPVIGIPLPFFSYGGSALWSFTILLFILLRIDASRKEA